MVWLKKKQWWGVLGVVVLVLGAAAALRSNRSPAKAAVDIERVVPSAPRVEVIRPTAGGLARTTVQPGSAHSFESVDLFAKVPGFLKSQTVDIGSQVKQGDVLAEIDAPEELAQELERDKALLRQAEAEVVQAKAHIASTVADQRAMAALVNQACANVKRFESEREFRDKQYQRIRELHALNSIEERLVDEKLDQLQAARSAELSAQSAVVTAEEQAAAAGAKVASAEADLLVAKSKVQVAEAGVSRAMVMLAYTRIHAPYDGVVTQRGFHPGAFIRSADQGEHLALLSVDRTDLMRVVVQVPDRDVPFTQPGDPSVIVFDALPSTRLAGMVARVSASENPESRTMRVEIDVPNQDGLIRDGMYGHVEIQLESAAGGVTVPSACLMGMIGSDRASVFVVDQGKARRVEVKLGKDTGKQVEIVSGLATTDEVILKPPHALTDGTDVQAVAAQLASNASH